MSGYFGRGIILIAISLIKQSWWLVLKTNFERIQKENARRNSFIEALENEKTQKEREELMKVIIVSKWKDEPHALLLDT